MKKSTKAKAVTTSATKTTKKRSKKVSIPGRKGTKPGMLQVEVPSETMLVAKTAKNNVALEVTGFLPQTILAVDAGMFENDVLGKLLKLITEKAQAGEMVINPKIVDLCKQMELFKLAMKSQSIGVLTQNTEDFFLAEGIQTSVQKVRDFRYAVNEFGADLAKIVDEYASEDSMYMREGFGVKAEDGMAAVPLDVIDTAIDSFRTKMAKLSTGLQAYHTIALTNAINKVGEFLSNKDIMDLCGAVNAAEMLNLLDLRVDITAVANVTKIKELLELVAQWDIEDEATTTNVAMYRLCSLAKSVNK